MDKEAVVRVLIREQSKLLAYLYSIVRESSLAEDLFQEVVVLAMQKHAEIADTAHLLLWARKAARFEGLKLLRDRRRAQVPLEGDVLDLLDAAWLQADATDLAQETDRLKGCMEQLSPKAREILQLKYFQSADGARIAGLLQTKVHSVYVTLSRIHKTLAECVGRQRLGGEHA
jgi:RNA polymerase sigma-70 factor, ECF subfamily